MDIRERCREVLRNYCRILAPSTFRTTRFKNLQKATFDGVKAVKSTKSIRELSSCQRDAGAETNASLRRKLTAAMTPKTPVTVGEAHASGRLTDDKLTAAPITHMLM
jgi:hypothetical protein